MTTIKATCPSCGDVDLTPSDLVVTQAPAAGWSTYSFACPECGTRVRKTVGDDVVTLLVTAGVPVEQVDIPGEALEPHHGPALTYDDLIDFVLLLGVTDSLVGVLVGERVR